MPDQFIKTQLTGAYLKSARVEFDKQTGEPYVSITFNKEGADLFEKLTNDNVGKRIGIYLDGVAISAPTVNEKITGGQAVINGQFTPKQAKDLAERLNFGALPVLLSATDAREVYDFTTKGTPNYGKYIYVYAHIKDGTDEKKIAAAQADLSKKDYFTQSSKDIQKQITQIVNILQILVGVFGLITLVASIFGIVNTQYISVLERTREIGLMKALGMRGKDVRRLFMLEAGWIGFLGGSIGAIIAIVVGIPLNPWISKKMDLGEGNSLLIFSPVQIILLIGALVVVAMLAGFLPARKAAKLDPIEALRTE